MHRSSKALDQNRQHSLAFMVCSKLEKRTPAPSGPEQTIWEVFEVERTKLIPYRARFDGYHALPAAVSKTCLIRSDNSKYSAGASAVGRPVDIRAYADHIVIRQDGRIVAEHRRGFGGTRRSATPGIMRPSWRASRAPCAMAHRSKTGLADGHGPDPAAPRHQEQKAAHAPEQDRPDILKRRKAWFEGQLDLDPDRLVFIDET